MPERCTAARCDNTADPAKGINMHRIPSLNSEINAPMHRDEGKNGSTSSWRGRRTGSPGKRLHCAGYISNRKIFSSSIIKD